MNSCRLTIFSAVIAFFCWNVQPCLAGKVDVCSEPGLGDVCKFPVMDLEVTQFAVGMRVVQRKYEKMLKMSKEELKDYLKKNPVPVVRAPDGRYYMTDHHHQTLAALKVGRENVFVVLQHDYSKLSSMDAFWKKMTVNKLVYLYDENGEGPHDPKELPKDVTALKDDPYRSFAADVKRNGGYRSTSVPFTESYWAQFFRERVKIGSGEDGYEKAMEEALRLAMSSSAKNLPGYIGDRVSREKVDDGQLKRPVGSGSQDKAPALKEAIGIH